MIKFWLLDQICKLLTQFTKIIIFAKFEFTGSFILSRLTDKDEPKTLKTNFVKFYEFMLFNRCLTQNDLNSLR